MRAVLLVLILFTFYLPATAQTKQDEAAFALDGFDPIELIAGREVKGHPDLATEHGKYRYAFSNPENRKTFEKAPDRFAIQFDGACMKMGPLSGGGSPSRYFVFDGRIYVFASESCRETFKADPKRFIDRADEAPTGNDASVKKASKLLAQAISGVGGEDQLKNLKVLQINYQITAMSGEKEVRYTRTAATAFPETYVEMSDWGTGQSGWLLRPENGYLSWEEGRPVGMDVRNHMLREFYRQPIHILKAWQAQQAKAVHLGQGTVGDTPIEKVAVSVRGATTILSIDPQSGRILSTEYQGRAGVGIGHVERVYSDFREIKGLRVPFTVMMQVDGKAVTNPVVTITSVQINETLDPALLKIPH